MYDRPLLCPYRKWKPGQPDNWGHGHELGEDCAGLIHEGLWNDFFCEDLISYICEKDMETRMSISVFFLLNKYLVSLVSTGELMSFYIFFCSKITWIVAVLKGSLQ